MPELVEVFTMSDKINKKIENHILEDINIISGRYTKKLPKNYEKFKKDLPLKINTITSKGKFIYILLDNGYSIWITLGLTGDLYMKNGDFNRTEYINGVNRAEIHDRVEFVVSDDRNFYLNDIRNFGTIHFSLNREELDKKLATLGVDPLRSDFSMKDFIEIYSKKNIQNEIIALALVNQKLIAGIGNYLRAEILYHAKISPFRKVKDLSKVEKEEIWKSMNHIVENIYKKDNYIPLVYGQEKTKNGEIVDKKNDSKGRTIWYVKSVQI